MQGTRYALPEVIAALGCDVEYWFVVSKTRVVAGVPIIIHNKAGQNLPIHSYYIGLMYHQDIFNSKANRRTECELAISEFVMQALSLRYSEFKLSLHPSLQDVRGIDWFNYHEPEKGRAVIAPRYTACAELNSCAAIRAAARGSRRREEKYAISRERLSFSIEGEVGELIDLYSQTLEKQAITLASQIKQATADFAALILNNGMGNIGVVKNENNIAVAAGLLFYDYNQLVHLPVVGIGASQYAGTFLYFKIMDHASKLGYKQIDFNGANSPKRGYFKHSIGGQAQLYFEINWRQPTV